MRERDLADLAGSIYDAATDSIEWTELGDRLCRHMDVQRVYLGIPQPDGTLPNLLRASNPFDIAYSEYYHKVDPFRLLTATAARDGPTSPHAVLAENMGPKSDFLRSEYYADYARRRGARHSIGAQLDARGQTLIGIFRESAVGAFTSHDVQCVEFLLPHLWRGLQLRRTLAVPAPAASAGLAALDALPLSVVVVDASMHVVFVNEAAERMTSGRGSALRIVHSGLPAMRGDCVLATSYAGDDLTP